MTMTKGERTELRSIVRQQFKVLRSEIEQRRKELIAGIEEELSVLCADDDRQWEGVKHEVQEAVLEANRRINDALYAAEAQVKGRTEAQYVHVYGIERPPGNKSELRTLAVTKLDAKVRGALLGLERQEADLLRDLAVGALESDEAQAFLSAIPTVSELVPTARLAELERALDGPG